MSKVLRILIRVKFNAAVKHFKPEYYDVQGFLLWQHTLSALYSQ